MARTDLPRKSPLRWIITGVLTAFGLLAGYLSWAVRESDPWWSSALINASVVFLLLVPSELALRRIWRTVGSIERTSTYALQTAESARVTAEKTERSLEDVRDALVARQREELDAEMDVYRRMVCDPSREAIVTALHRATESDLITTAGVRSPVWETPLHYRYRLHENSDDLSVSIERDDGSVISTHRWSGQTTAVAFYQELVEGIREAGEDLGTGLNLPTESVKDLSEMLVDVTQLRAQELMGHRQTLRRIIERIDGWYFTEMAVLPADNLHYSIDVERLNEMDWEQHLRDKGWYRAEYMIPFARTLYGPERIRESPHRATSSPPKKRRTDRKAR